MGFDDRGKVRLSMKCVDQETGEEIQVERSDDDGDDNGDSGERKRRPRRRKREDGDD